VYTLQFLECCLNKLDGLEIIINCKVGLNKKNAG